LHIVHFRKDEAFKAKVREKKKILESQIQ